MIEIRIVQSEDPNPNQREAFKQYASVPDNSRDALLDGCLKRAMMEVQNYSGTAVLPCTFEMTVTDVARNEELKLYQSGSVVESVSDADGPIGYELNGRSIRLARGSKAVMIRYRNEIIESDRDRVMPVVWQYAVALYDGEDARVLAEILKQTY